jgi:hypothetical protein
MSERSEMAAGPSPDASAVTTPTVSLMPVASVLLTLLLTPMSVSEDIPEEDTSLTETERLVRDLGDDFVNRRLDAARRLESPGWQPADERERVLRGRLPERFPCEFRAF